MLPKEAATTCKPKGVKGLDLTTQEHEPDRNSMFFWCVCVWGGGGWASTIQDEQIFWYKLGYNQFQIITDLILCHFELEILSL